MEFSDLLDLAYESRGFQYNWICAVCLLNAHSGVILEFQFLDELHNILCLF